LRGALAVGRRSCRVRSLTHPDDPLMRMSRKPTNAGRAYDALKRSELSNGLLARIVLESLRGLPIARPRSRCHLADQRLAPVVCSQATRPPASRHAELGTTPSGERYSSNVRP
jgi:hypothetical protein